jgi:hypothetical protein
VVIIAVVAVRSSQLAPLYREAMDARNNGDYETAVSLFTELGNYKDSAQQVALSQEASEVVASKAYRVLKSSFSDDGETVSYDVDARTVTCNHAISSDLLDNLSSSASLRKNWTKLCDTMDDSCAATTDRFTNNGFDGIVVTFSLTNKDTGKIVYSTTDGVSTYNYLDTL